MIKVLVLEPPMNSNTGWWRLWRPLQVVRKLYGNLFEFQFKQKELNYYDAWSADVIIQARPGGTKTVAEQTAINDFVEMAKGMGARFIVDVDDQVLEVPRGHSLHAEYFKPERRKAIEKCLALADAFWFSSPAFLGTISTSGQVMPNAIFQNELPAEPSPDERVGAWRGHSIQMHDLTTQGVVDWPNIKVEAKDWFWIGFMPPLAGDFGHEIPYVELPDKYLANLMRTPINALWKPMQVNPFNDHKSNIAWIEATVAGGYCLTNYAGRPGWEYATKHWLTHSDGVKLWEKSCEVIVQDYNLIHWGQKRAESIVALVPHLIPRQNA